MEVEVLLDSAERFMQGWIDGSQCLWVTKSQWKNHPMSWFVDMNFACE
jgi:hypothetical protein